MLSPLTFEVCGPCNAKSKRSIPDNKLLFLLTPTSELAEQKQMSERYMSGFRTYGFSRKREFLRRGNAMASLMTRFFMWRPQSP